MQGFYYKKSNVQCPKSNVSPAEEEPRGVAGPNDEVAYSRCPDVGRSTLDIGLLLQVACAASIGEVQDEQRVASTWIVEKQ